MHGVEESGAQVAEQQEGLEDKGRDKHGGAGKKPKYDVLRPSTTCSP